MTYTNKKFGLALLLLSGCTGGILVDSASSPRSSAAPAAAMPAAPATIPIDPSLAMPAASYSSRVALVLGQQSSVLIDGRSDIFSSGMAVADQGRGGMLPAVATLDPAGGKIEFSQVHGLAGCGPGQTSSPDGGNCAGGNTNLGGTAQISGIVDHQHSQFLVGVFLGDSSIAASSAPEALDFSQAVIGEAFAELSPQLGQSFYIGDGLIGTGTGDTQKFFIPAGATHLYLAYADGAAFQGAPGWYADNTGGVSASLVQSR